LAHANGDAAIDQYLNVIANAQKKYDASQRRDVIIHAQTMREDQLDRAKQLHLIPIFFFAYLLLGRLACGTNLR
jgi:predicted amidohydrolase YtcJ